MKKYNESWVIYITLSLSLSLSACGGGNSPDLKENTQPITGNNKLDEYIKFATDYQGLSYIRSSYANLNKDDKSDNNIILGTFYGMTPNEASYIYFDVSLKSDNRTVTIGTNLFNLTDERLKVWVAGHETCHYSQWINGVKFDQGHLPHDDRWYERECNDAGHTVLLEWDKTQ